MANKKIESKKTDGDLTDIFLSFRPALERLLRKFVGRDDAEDIISETYLRTNERFGNEEIAYPKAFLYKTSRNLALNYLSKHENRLTDSLEGLPLSDVYLLSEELESQIEAQAKFRLFCSAVESLPPKCRKAFLLKRVHGWTCKSIAEEMGISVSTVEKHVAKGLLRCANSLEEHGYDLKGRSTKADKKNIQKSP